MQEDRNLAMVNMKRVIEAKKAEKQGRAEGKGEATESSGRYLCKPPSLIQVSIRSRAITYFNTGSMAQATWGTRYMAFPLFQVEGVAGPGRRFVTEGFFCFDGQQRD